MDPNAIPRRWGDDVVGPGNMAGPNGVPVPDGYGVGQTGIPGFVATESGQIPQGYIPAPNQPPVSKHF